MFGKAIKSIKEVLNDVKDSVKETVNSVSIPKTTNILPLNEKHYIEDKLLGEGGYEYVYKVSNS